MGDEGNSSEKNPAFRQSRTLDRLDSLLHFNDYV